MIFVGEQFQTQTQELSLFILVWEPPTVPLPGATWASVHVVEITCSDPLQCLGPAAARHGPAEKALSGIWFQHPGKSYSRNSPFPSKNDEGTFGPSKSSKAQHSTAAQKH